MTYKLDDNYDLQVYEDQDIDHLIKEMYTESPLSDSPIDWNHIEILKKHFSGLGNGNIILVLNHQEHGAVGFLVGMIVPNFFNPKVAQAAELGWYVMPEHRKTYAWALIQAFEHWAKAANANKITLANYGTPQLNAKYEELGYKLHEYSFSKDI